MIDDVDTTATHRVLKIGELTRLIASQLVLISQKSAVDLACSSQYLEEPVLSTLWETQSSFCTLLEVLPRQTWHIQGGGAGWDSTVRGLNLLLEKSNAGAQGCFSSQSWGIRRHRTGTEYSATQLGCVRPVWMSG